MKLLITLLAARVFGMELATECPKSTRLQEGLCYYDIPYLENLPDNGLKKPFPVFSNGFAPKVIDLGRVLFFDPLLSRDSTVSCAHCHHPDSGFSDGLARGLGTGAIGAGPERKGGTLLKRSSPTLWNIAFHTEYFWDGRAKTLEDQARGPLFSPDEMGSTPEGLEKKLNANAIYKKLFRDAFGDKFAGRITTDLVVEAISHFERTLVTMNSRYDRYVFGERTALSAHEIKGLTLFRSFLTRCTECHTPPLFTNFQSAIIGAPESFGTPVDQGKALGEFRIPTLRNIALTAPYMHSGGLKNLADVVNFYSEGGGRGPLGIENQYLHWHITPIKLSAKDQDAIVSFLLSLTDEENKPKIPESLPSGLRPVSGGQHAL